jgi:sulfite reductase (NADPH) hemoprotein beta-component
LIDAYVDQRHEEERFIDTVLRVGMEPFKTRVYGAPKKEAVHG